VSLGTHMLCHMRATFFFEMEGNKYHISSLFNLTSRKQISAKIKPPKMKKSAKKRPQKNISIIIN